MSSIQNHKIHTTSLQVNFEGREEGMGVQDSLGLFFYEKIQPALLKAFDQYGDPKKTLVIDRLELDCGKIFDKNWEKVFLQRILKQLDEELISSPKSKHLSVSIEAKASEVFFLFLQKGYFPWNSPFSTPKELEKAIVLDSAFLKNLYTIFPKSSAFPVRLFKSFSQEFVSGIFDFMTQKSNPRMDDLIKHFLTNRSVQQDLMLVLLNNFQNQSPVTVASILRDLISNLSKENLSYLAEYISRKIVRDRELSLEMRSLLSEKATSEIREKLLVVLKIIHRKDSGILVNAGISLNDFEQADSTLEKAFQESLLSDDSFEAQEKLNTTSIYRSQKKLLDLEDEIFIENAGLVLVHPFLERLFSSLHLTEERNFVSNQNQLIAAKILQFLAFGENEHSENFYPLNKILCGIGLTQVLDLDVELPRESKTECEHLLKEVIGHWSVLKNTSVEGLRETFLQRNGKLIKVEKGWKLQVERKTVDVLLAKLPWGIGIIKMPWMTEMIFVEWE